MEILNRNLIWADSNSHNNNMGMQMYLSQWHVTNINSILPNLYLSLKAKKIQNILEKSFRVESEHSKK